MSQFFCVQHYQKDADGLCTRLKTPVDKEGQHLFVVDLNDFKESMFGIRFAMRGACMCMYGLQEGKTEWVEPSGKGWVGEWLSEWEEGSGKGWVGGWLREWVGTKWEGLGRRMAEGVGGNQVGRAG